VADPETDDLQFKRELEAGKTPVRSDVRSPSQPRSPPSTSWPTPSRSGTIEQLGDGQSLGPEEPRARQAGRPGRDHVTQLLALSLVRHL